MNYKAKGQRKPQRPSKQTDKVLATKIIRKANKYKHKLKGRFYYRIASILSIRIERVKTCLRNASTGERTMFSIRDSSKNYKYHFYTVNQWVKQTAANKCQRNEKNVNRSIKNAEKLIAFIKNCYDDPLLLELANGTEMERYVRRSVNEYLHQYESKHGLPPVGKSTIYRHIKHNRPEYKRCYFARLYKGLPVKRAKVNFPKLPFAKIDKQPPVPKHQPHHYQADSVIGKSTDKKALATTIDVATGKVTIDIYDRKGNSFGKIIASRIGKKMRSLRIDNGVENSRLGEYLPTDKIFTCFPYRSWEKAQIENMHRLIRRVWPKGRSMDLLTPEAVAQIEQFVNSYYRPRYSK